jgi:hypothetical protein
MCELNWLLLLEYLKVLLSWPPIALVIALIFFRCFQPAINSFLGRVIEGNFFGQVFKAAPPSQSLESGSAEDFLTKAAGVQPHTDAQPNVEALAPLPPELANDPQAPAAIEWVKNNPAQTVIEYKRLALNYSFERLFNAIYGTQISLLEFLASRSNESVSLAQLAKFHQEYLSKPGATAYQLRDYVNFLVIYGVIVDADPPHQQAYSIAPHGIQFLSYIKANYPLGWYQRNF